MFPLVLSQTKELGFKFDTKPSVSSLIQAIAYGKLLVVSEKYSKTLLSLALLGKLSSISTRFNKANETELLMTIAYDTITIIPRTKPETELLEAIAMTK